MAYSKDELLKATKKNEQAEIECLRKLIRIPTCYDKKHNMDPLISQLSAEFKERGYEVQVIPTAGAAVVVAELNQGRERTLLFYNHYDVQPEEPLNEWKTPPYELTLKNERLYGRGVNDNKGPLVANIFGIQNAVEAGYDLKCNIRFIIEGEEEAGSPHLEEFCQTHPDLLQADGCVWEWANAIPNQQSKVYAGVKGDAYFELRVNGFSKDAHSGDAPIVVNPAWRLVWALSTLKNKHEEITIKGFYDDVVPPKKEELELFTNYPPEQIEEYKEQYTTDQFLLDRDGVEFWKELTLRPTCTICGLSAGWEGPGAKTVIGKTAMAKVDFRLVPNQTAEHIKILLRRHLDEHGFTDVKTRFLNGYKPNRTPITHPFIQLLAGVTREFSGKEPILIPSAGGSGPAYLFGDYTPWAMSDIFDPETNIHAPNESIRLDDFRSMTALISAITIQIGET